MKTNSKVVIGSITLALFAAVGTLALQPPLSWSLSLFAFHYSLGLDTLMFFLHLGAASLFFMSLGVYKAGLRRAFLGIVLGIILIGLGTLQLPILDLFDKWNSPYVTDGFIGLPFLVSGLLMYIGAATFGRLVGDRQILTNKVIGIGAAVLLAGGTMFLPHVTTSVKESSFDASNVVLSLTMFLLIWCACIFLSIKRRIGVHYQYAMLWTGLALLGSATCLFLAVFDTLISTATRDHITELLNLVTVIAGFAWLKAGYAFTVTKEY